MRKIIRRIYYKTPELCVCLLVNLWISFRRRKYRYETILAKRKVMHARKQLEDDYLTRASTQDRGYVLPEHNEAIGILHRSEWMLNDDLAIWLR